MTLTPRENKYTEPEGSYTEGSYTEGSYTEGSYTEGSYTEGSYTEGSYTEGSYMETYPQARGYAPLRYQDSIFQDSSRFQETSRYQDSSRFQDSYVAPSQGRGYAPVPVERPMDSYMEGSYMEGSYMEGSYTAPTASLRYAGRHRGPPPPIPKEFDID